MWQYVYCTGCGGILKQQQGTIQSPNYPLFYPNDHTCQWIIVGSVNTVVQLTWQSFHLEGSRYRGNRDDCPYDRVIVFDNSSVPEHGGIMGTWVWIMLTQIECRPLLVAYSSISQRHWIMVPFDQKKNLVKACTKISNWGIVLSLALSKLITNTFHFV